MYNGQALQFIGDSAPIGGLCGENVVWKSSHAAHVTVPHGPSSRRPIVGSEYGQGAAQEFSPWYNPTLRRYEAIVNMSGNFMFTFCDTPDGDWSNPVQVYGNGAGGEASPAPQASVYVEGSSIYVFYCPNTSGTMVAMAKATMPTTVGVLPVFTKIGNVWDTTYDALASESPWVVKAHGIYYIFNKRNKWIYGTTTSLDTAATTTPFITVSSALVFGLLGSRMCYGWGRPQVFYEDGVWVLFSHVLSSLDLGYAQVRRWVCYDKTNPVNWIEDTSGPVVRKLNQLECDQVCDFRLFRDNDGNSHAYWSANNNNSTKFSIMHSRVLTPDMRKTATGWTPVSGEDDTQNEQPYVICDTFSANATIKNTFECPVDTAAGAISLTLPKAASRSKFKVANTASSGAGNPVHLIVQSGDLLTGGVQIASMSAVGSVVTVTTKFPHRLSTYDFVTVTGCTPAAYNVSGAAVTAVTELTFQYTAGSAPGASTTVGAYDNSVRVGESRSYKVYKPSNTWIRE